MVSYYDTCYNFININNYDFIDLGDLSCPLLPYSVGPKFLKAEWVNASGQDSRSGSFTMCLKICVCCVSVPMHIHISLSTVCSSIFIQKHWFNLSPMNQFLPQIIGYDIQIQECPELKL